MRGNTLNELTQMLRRELRVADSPSLSKNVNPSYEHALRSAQERLYAGHDWPFKIIRRDITMQAGQRYYAPPTDMDLENLREEVAILYSGQWFGVSRGISPAEYNVFNSDTGQRLDPVRRWDIYNDPSTDGDMIEAWPIPASNGGLLRFKGVRKLGQLVNQNDRAYLDGTLIVLFAAIDLVPKDRLSVATQKAADHLFSLKRNLSNGATFVSGGGVDPRDGGRRPPQIVITPATEGG